MPAGAPPDLGGHVACVTGASAGLGRRAALVLARAGASVVAVARREAALATLVDEAPGPVTALPYDLSDRAGLADLAAQAAAPYGAPDIVVHAAGLNTRETADAVTPAGWDATMTLNLAVPFFLSQHLVPGMRARGWGRIVTFASLQSHRAFPGGEAAAETGDALAAFHLGHGMAHPQPDPQRVGLLHRGAGLGQHAGIKDHRHV